MTHEDDIPELIGELEGSLTAPDADALRAGLASRQKRRRGAASIAAILAVAGIGFGAWAITADDATTTETAAGTAEDDGLHFEFGGDTDAIGSVADDSAPRLEGFVMSPDIPVRDQMVGEPWVVGGVRGDTLGFKAQTGHVHFNADPDEFSLPKDVDTVLYVDECSGSAYTIEWLSDINFSDEDLEFFLSSADSFRVVSKLDVIPSAANVNCVEMVHVPTLAVDAIVTLGSGPLSVVTMGVVCPPLAICAPTGLWSIDLTRGDEAPSVIRAGVAIRGCANESSIALGSEKWLPKNLPPEWEGQGSVQVTVAIDGDTLVATDENDLTAVFFRDDGGDRDAYCSGFTYEQPTSTTAAPSATTSTAPPPTTSSAPATTAPPLPTEPPSFTPTADAVLSGQWELVSLWNEGDRVDLAGFGGTPTISIFGRRIGGDDVCNSQGGGLVYATADGTIRIEGGATTEVGCRSNLARQTYDAALYSNDRWGFTSNGNLVIGTGGTLAEYRLAEALPAASLINLSAPLNTLWTGDSHHDYNSFNESNSTIDLHFEGDSIAVITDEVCGEFGYQATYVDANEGPISFEFLGPGAEPCEATGDAATVLAAMERADYFATAPGGVMFWDGAQPLATFATE